MDATSTTFAALWAELVDIWGPGDEFAYRILHKPLTPDDQRRRNVMLANLPAPRREPAP